MENMQNIFDKKDFYRMILRDRLPIVCVEFIMERKRGGGRIDFFSTPLGVVLRASLYGSNTLKEIKIYDRKRGSFFIQNVFCGDNLIETDVGVFVGVSNKLQIEDVMGRDIFIKLDGANIVAKAELVFTRQRNVDKVARLVYN